MSLSERHEKVIRDWLIEQIGETFEVESRKARVTVDVASIPLDIVPRGLVHGLTQRIGDKVAGFKGKPVSEIEAAMLKVVDAIYGGEWQDQTARLYSVARGVLESAYPKAEIPAKGTFALRDVKSLAFWCARMHDLFPSDRLPQGPKPEAVLAKAERIIRERDAAVEDLA